MACQPRDEPLATRFNKIGRAMLDVNINKVRHVGGVHPEGIHPEGLPAPQKF